MNLRDTHHVIFLELFTGSETDVISLNEGLVEESVDRLDTYIWSVHSLEKYQLFEILNGFLKLYSMRHLHFKFTYSVKIPVISIGSLHDSPLSEMDS